MRRAKMPGAAATGSLMARIIDAPKRATLVEYRSAGAAIRPPFSLAFRKRLCLFKFYPRAAAAYFALGAVDAIARAAALAVFACRATIRRHVSASACR